MGFLLKKKEKILRFAPMWGIYLRQTFDTSIIKIIYNIWRLLIARENSVINDAIAQRCFCCFLCCRQVLRTLLANKLSNKSLASLLSFIILYIV
jgi:hypothetical protein